MSPLELSVLTSCQTLAPKMDQTDVQSLVCFSFTEAQVMASCFSLELRRTVKRLSSVGVAPLHHQPGRCSPVLANNIITSGSGGRANHCNGGRATAKLTGETLVPPCVCERVSNCRLQRLKCEPSHETEERSD